jgi:hypothetical protein
MTEAMTEGEEARQAGEGHGSPARMRALSRFLCGSYTGPMVGEDRDGAVLFQQVRQQGIRKVTGRES